MHYIRRLGTLFGVLAIAALVAGPASAATGDVTATIDAGGGGTPCPIDGNYGTMPPPSSGTVSDIDNTVSCSYGGSVPITITNQAMSASFQSGGVANLWGTLTFDAYGGIFQCTATVPSNAPLTGTWSGPNGSGDYPFSVSKAAVAVAGSGGLGCPLTSPIGPVVVAGSIDG